jgi:hypothetical protein
MSHRTSTLMSAAFWKGSRSARPTSAADSPAAPPGYLKGTPWNGKAADVWSYLHVRMSGYDAIVSISAKAGGAATKVADLHGSGAVDLQTLLAHATI